MRIDLPQPRRLAPRAPLRARSNMPEGGGGEREEPQRIGGLNTRMDKKALDDSVMGTANGGIIPSLPAPRVTLPNGQKLDLPPRLYQGYVEALQGAELQAFERLSTDPRWYSLPEEAAVKYLTTFYDRSPREAKKRWMYANGRELVAEYRKLEKQKANR